MQLNVGIYIIHVVLFAKIIVITNKGCMKYNDTNYDYEIIIIHRREHSLLCLKPQLLFIQRLLYVHVHVIIHVNLHVHVHNIISYIEIFDRYSDKPIIVLDMYQYYMYVSICRLVSDFCNQNEHFLNNYEYHKSD